MANAVVINAAYHIWSAEKDTPIWKSVTANPITKLCEGIWVFNSPRNAPGMIMGVLYNDKNPIALIDNQILYEGQTMRGIKVVKINAHEVQFEMKGETWTQGIQERPHKLWGKCG